MDEDDIRKASKGNSRGHRMKSTHTTKNQPEPTRIGRKQEQETVQAPSMRAEEQKATADAIIAAIGDGISIQDTDFKIVYQNQIHKDLV